MCIDRCNEVQATFYVPTLHQFQYEIEDGYRRDQSPVRIGYDEAVFPGYSWQGYGAYSQLQNEVLLPVSITNPSVYRMVLRYSNPNQIPVIGEATVTPASGAVVGGELGGEQVERTELGEPQSHKVRTLGH